YHTAYLFCIPHLLAALSTFRAELPAETGTRLRRSVEDPVCALYRVFVLHAPRTFPPANTSSHPSCHTASALSYAWQRKHTCPVRGADHVSAGRKAFLNKQQQGRTFVDSSRSHSVEPAHTVRISDFARGSEAWAL